MTALYDDCRHADLSVNCQTEFHHITKQSNYSHTFVIQVIQIPNLVKKKKKMEIQNMSLLRKKKILTSSTTKRYDISGSQKILFKTVWSVMQSKCIKHYSL